MCTIFIWDLIYIFKCMNFIREQIGNTKNMNICRKIMSVFYMPLDTKCWLYFNWTMVKLIKNTLIKKLMTEK